MADCGIASRRKCEELISQGFVRINGELVTQMGITVDPSRDIVTYQGKRVHPHNKKQYIMLNKPSGYVSTCKDEKGRHTVMELLAGIQERLYPVGRLDFTTEGLLLMTNDGALANILTHPRHNVEKKYVAVVRGTLTDEEITHLETGVNLEGYKTNRAIFHITKAEKERTELLCVITEGKNRQLRRMFEAVGKDVIYLKRVGVGDIKLGNLKKGEWRRLTPDEISYLQKLA